MSFKCHDCKETVWEAQNMQVIATRPKTYVNEQRDGREKITYGYETVKEVPLCSACKAKRK